MKKSTVLMVDCHQHGAAYSEYFYGFQYCVTAFRYFFGSPSMINSI